MLTQYSRRNVASEDEGLLIQETQLETSAVSKFLLDTKTIAYSNDYRIYEQQIARCTVADTASLSYTGIFFESWTAL